MLYSRGKSEHTCQWDSEQWVASVNTNGGGLAKWRGWWWVTSPAPPPLFFLAAAKPQLLPSTKTTVNMRRTHWPAAVNSLLSCCLFLRVSVIECLERSCSNVRVEGPVFQAFIDSRCFGAGWPPLPEARPRWVARKRERRPAAKLLARRSPRPRAVHHRHLYFHLNAWRSSLKPNTPIHVVGFDMFDFLHNKRS